MVPIKKCPRPIYLSLLMGPKKESPTNLENQMEKIMNKSMHMQTNENIENFKRTIADTNNQLKKTT